MTGRLWLPRSMQSPRDPAKKTRWYKTRWGIVGIVVPIGGTVLLAIATLIGPCRRRDGQTELTVAPETDVDVKVEPAAAPRPDEAEQPASSIAKESSLCFEVAEQGEPQRVVLPEEEHATYSCVVRNRADKAV